MGVLAPDLAALCAHNLRGRDPIGLAEDYLSAVGWPMHMPSSARGKRRHGRAVAAARLSGPRGAGLLKPPTDPCCN